MKPKQLSLLHEKFMKFQSLYVRGEKEAKRSFSMLRKEASTVMETTKASPKTVTTMPKYVISWLLKV
jgi:hypothetical protein